MKKELVGYQCKNCGKEKAYHKADTYECQNPGRGSFKGFRETKFEEDLNKPVYGFKL